VTAATTGAFAVNGSPGGTVVSSRPMAGPPGPSPQRSPQSFTRQVADNVDRCFASFPRFFSSVIGKTRDGLGHLAAWHLPGEPVGPAYVNI